MNINLLFQHSFDKNFSFLHQLLEKIQAPALPQISELIYTMDEVQHSLIFMYLGNGLLIRGINPALLKKFENFLLNFSREQVLFNVKKLCEITEKYIDIMIANKIGIKAIKIIERLINGKAEFTGIHSQFALLCLKMKMYKASSSIINLPILTFSEEFNANQNDIFTYYYYRGVLFTGLKEYNKAIDSFSTCLNLEINSVYQPQIEAKKKLILLLLLENKKVQLALSQQTAHFKPIFHELIDLKTSVYLGLLEKDIFRQPIQFENYLTTHVQQFMKDKNLVLFLIFYFKKGLAKKLRYSIYLNILKSFRKTYTSLSNEQLFDLLSLPKKFDIASLIFTINEIKPIAKINRLQNSIEFIDPNQIEYDKIVGELQEEYKKMKPIIEEFQDAYEVLIKERLASPDAMFA